jgi:hypothetical protein
MDKWTKQKFCKQKSTNGQKHMKKHSTTLAIKEIQIKNMLRLHLTPERIAIISSTTNNRCWRGCGGKRNPLTLLVGM